MSYVDSSTSKFPMTFMLRSNPSVTVHRSYMDLSQKFYESMKDIASFRSVLIARKLHAQLISIGLVSSTFLQNHLIIVYSKCGFIDDAFRVFRGLEFPNVFSWNTMIGGLAGSGRVTEAGQLFEQMPKRDTVSWNSMMSGYFNNGEHKDALKVFASMILDGVAQFGHKEEALALFQRMRKVPMALDQFTIATILGVSSSLKDIALGGQLHAYAIMTGMDSFVPVGNSLLTMYSKCGYARSASCVFQLMPIRDTVSWTVMVTTFSQSGEIEKALEYFNKMPERTVITWNSMLSAYTKEGFWEDGLRLYILMLRDGVKPDWVTFATLTSACADSAVLNLGSQIISQVEKSGFGFDVSVANSIITMYSRCGRIGDAQRVFDSVVTKDLISWNAMMDGYVQSGQVRKMLETFENMLKMGFTPDKISYVSVLSGCSHSGLVLEGKRYFNMMTREHDIHPNHEHFACMIDLFARAGLLEQAKNFIDEMPLEPNYAVWGALLGGCRIHGNAELAEIAVKNLTELEVRNSGRYVLLANLYSDSGELDGVTNVRKFIRERGIRKNPGCSWIEVGNSVHVFTVDHTNHPRIKDIYRMLEIFNEIEETGNYI